MFSKKCYFLAFLFTFSLSAVLLVLDALIEKHHPYYCYAVSFFMVLVLVLLGVFYDEAKTRLLNGPGLVPQQYARAFNPVGVLVGIFVPLALQCRPKSLYLYLFLLTAPMSSFSLIMVLKPVNTDMGLFYPFFGLSVGYYYGVSTLATVVAGVLSVTLIILRATCETLAVIQVFKRKENMRRSVKTACAEATSAAAAAAATASDARILALALGADLSQASRIADAISACANAASTAAAAAASAAAIAADI